MVYIPKGTFLMGSSDGSNYPNYTAGDPNLNTTPAEANRETEETQHQVTLTKGFYMSKYAVTVAQYDAFCDATSTSKPNDMGWGRGDRSVTGVSCHYAVAYCTWLSEQTGQTWRLPTEAEWEYACRAGTTTSHSFGTNSIDDYAWYQGNSGFTTHEVGTKLPNPWGLYDMHGNVWEWCSDWFVGYTADDATDPTGPASGNSKILRGGTWKHAAQNCRSAYRMDQLPTARYDDFGFRVVLVP